MPEPAPLAISLPHALISRVPVLGRSSRRQIEILQTRAAMPEPVRRKILRLPRRALILIGLRDAPEPKIAPPPAIPFVSPVMRRMREPIERTARVVQVAREVRRPKSRWERLREAAELALEDPVRAMRWEQLMGLGVALAARPAAKRQALSPRSRLARLVRAPEPPPAPKPGLRARLLARLLPKPAKPGGAKKKADPGKLDRPRKRR